MLDIIGGYELLSPQEGYPFYIKISFLLQEGGKKAQNCSAILNMKCGQRFIRFLSVQWSLLIREPVRVNWQNSTDSIYM